MAELDLPAGPAELLQAVRRPLADHLGGEHHIRLGGGTALAARWVHRHSTDVDLFVSHKAYVNLYRNAYRFTADVEHHSSNIEQLGVGLGYTLIALRDGEITILASEGLTNQPISADTVRGTRIAVDTNAEILAGKFAHRLAEFHDFVPRDFYDIAVARRLDPKALDTALATIPSPLLEGVLAAIDNLPPDWADNHRDPLLQPAHPEEAADSVGIVHRLIERYLDDRIPPAPAHHPFPSRGR